MKEITKTTVKEYDGNGKLIKHTETTVEVEKDAESDYTYIRYVPFVPDSKTTCGKFDYEPHHAYVNGL